MQIVVIGGGAAGFFAAANAAGLHPQAKVIILEKTGKLLTKVRISGGGRCNVTHDCPDNRLLATHYPRGEKQLLAAFSRFAVEQVVAWFEAHGVQLKVEEDGRMFPVSNDSAAIVNCLLGEAEKGKVQVRLHADVKKIIPGPGGFEVQLEQGGTVPADKVIIATGGHPKNEAYNWLRDLGHNIVPPVPSLFTFNIPGNGLSGLMGVSVPHARVEVPGIRYTAEGPLLITHWGLSGPCILKLSAVGARQLSACGYRFTARVAWLGKMNEEKLRLLLDEKRRQQAAHLVYADRSLELPRRLWEFLLERCAIPAQSRWADLSNKLTAKLAGVLLHDEYQVSGKTTFKEEFVTCGGVSLKEVDFRTMESKLVKGLFFAGEVLDIDGLTGGFNFQAAWTTAMIAARSLVDK
jgi:predicted Rossmann fold flavoprotein